MSYFQAFLSDKFVNIQIKDNFIISDDNSVQFEIEKEINNRFFKIKNNEDFWLFISYDRQLAWFSDLTKSYRSLCIKDYKNSIENKCIYIVDKGDKKYLNYRVGRAGSTSILTSFYKEQNDRKEEVDNVYCRMRIKNVVNHFEDLDENFNKDEYLKFFIYRDPIQYFRSQLFFLINQGHSLAKVPGQFRKYIETNNFYFQWLYTVYELNNLFNNRDEFHITQQYYILNDFDKNDISIDYMVSLNDISIFFDKVLQVPYFVSIINKRRDEQTLDKILSKEQIDMIQNVNKCDYQLFETYKDKLFELNDTY